MELKRACTKNDIYCINFDYKSYNFPLQANEVDAILVMKQWGRKMNLICYFQTTENNKIKLCAYVQRDLNGRYSPRESDIDMSQISLGTKMRIKYSIGKTGVSIWNNAQILN